MNNFPKFNNFHLPVFIILPAVFVLGLLMFFLTFYSSPKADLSLNLASDVYSFQNFDIEYRIINKFPYAKKSGLLKFSLCNQGYAVCRDLGRKDIQLGPGEINDKISTVLDPQSDYGVANIVMSLYQKENNKLIAQASKTAGIRKLSDELYMNLFTDKEIVADGDFVKIDYTFINNSRMVFTKTGYALTVNFAGPLEIAQNSGRIISDISQDINVAQTVKGSATWVIRDYTNRQGGLFNVSLLLSKRNEKGELVPVTSVVKQIRWP